ncbi:MAG: hypothetical protein LBL00_04505 [Endomicrobium sp.]|jgi:hypothetical protein|nr:hypothetical protein [Endomicrobium sp.]
MNKIRILIVLSAAALFFNCISFAGLQKETPYSPPSAKKYAELKGIFSGLTAGEIEKSINIANRPEMTDIVNNILIYLKYKKLVKQTKKLPPIFFLYSKQNNVLNYAGGLYFDVENIIVLNANLLLTNNIAPNNLPKNMQQAVDFVTFASIISHELMHYEDLINESEVYNMDSAALNELKAYKRSEKVIEYFTKMTKAEADEIIPIPDFYNSVQLLEKQFIDIRKYYIKLINAAEIFLNNEDKIRETLGLDKDKFKMLSFSPKVLFNSKDGGHIVKIESSFLNFAQNLFFEINILSGTLKILNSPDEIKKFRENAKNITLVNKHSYTVTRTGTAKKNNGVISK